MAESAGSYYSRRFEVSKSARLSGAAAFRRDMDCNLENTHSICLYVLVHDSAVIYVGISKNIGNTLTTGHARDYPYKWLRKYQGQELEGHFFSFTEEFGGMRLEDVREAIEGEVVFEIRMRTGRWPFDQIEIHFREDLRPKIAIQRCVSFVVNKLMERGIVAGMALPTGR